MKRTAPPPRPRGPAILFLLTGLAAVIGGGLLVVRPDGGWLGMSRALLEETPFGSFLIPGLVLALVVGGSQLAAGLALVQRRSNDVRLALAAALVLAGWIAIQALMLGVVIWLQPLVFLIAILEAGMTASALPRKDRRGRGPMRASRA
ncbi:MAG: hypothetical protein IPH44_24810 [Myxococcales bacterium]|jgi:hypothetical protein|nr:hypothetical protein [Myxococcales bacterium]MBK7191624.1 hypothetical protein [Myxococcales bacterium]MBP6847040.1 hypothetical protein [Kofleriaceae bacterium]